MPNNEQATGIELTEENRLRHELVAEKHAQAKELLRKHGIDCWLTFSREGRDLLLPFVVGGDYLAGLAALMIFADGDSVAIVADYDRSQVVGIFDRVIPYSLDWLEPFRQNLAERQPASIAINYSANDFGIDGLTHGMYLKLLDALKPLNLDHAVVSAEPVATAVRGHKTASEIERMRRAAVITERICDDVTTMLKPGLTEHDVYEIVQERMATYEVDPAWDPSFCPTVASSRNRSGGHSAPTNLKLERGDALRLDFGVKVDGYASDMQRTWYLPRPGETAASPEIQRPFEAVRDGIQLAQELLRPGRRGYEIDEPVRNLIAERGFSFTHALGHQLGRLVHDGGMLLGPRNARYGHLAGGVIEAGMVFTLEPCVEMIGIEEDAVVTDNGCELLVAPQREIIVVA